MNRFEERIRRLRELLPGAGADGLYVTLPENVAYFTGTAGNDCALWIDETDAVILTDFRYREMAQSIGWLRLYETDARHSAVTFLKELSPARIGIEKEHLRLTEYLQLEGSLADHKLVLTQGLVESLRLVKDEDELEATRKACRIASDCFAHMCGFVRPGISEKRAALEIEHFMKLQGAEDLSFNTICVSGAGGSRPHAVPSDKLIEEGELLTRDYGCKV